MIKLNILETTVKHVDDFMINNGIDRLKKL